MSEKATNHFSDQPVRFYLQRLKQATVEFSSRTVGGPPRCRVKRIVQYPLHNRAINHNNLDSVQFILFRLLLITVHIFIII